MTKRTTRPNSQAHKTAEARPCIELGLEYKRRAQAKMHKLCKGDMEKFSQLCEETVARLEREGGFKFKRGVPAGWTAPEIDWTNLKAR